MAPIVPITVQMFCALNCYDCTSLCSLQSADHFAASCTTMHHDAPQWHMDEYRLLFVLCFQKLFFNLPTQSYLTYYIVPLSAEITSILKSCFNLFLQFLIALTWAYLLKCMYSLKSLKLTQRLNVKLLASTLFELHSVLTL